MAIKTGNRILLVTCEHCDKSIRHEKYEDHLSDVHNIITVKPITVKPKEMITRKNKTYLKTGKLTAPDKPIKLTLISRRSIRINKDTKCFNCGVMHNPVWEYAESSKGNVLICDFCKPRLVGRSFDRKSAFKYRILSGSFESGRRK